MAAIEYSRAVADPGPDGFHDGFGRGYRQGDRAADILCAGLIADQLPGPVECTVFVVGRQHFVTGLQSERANYGIEAQGDIGDEDQVFGIGVEEGAESLSRLQ